MISINDNQNLEITIDVAMLNITNTNRILSLLNDAVQKHHEKSIEINLGNVVGIDSSAIAMLLKFSKQFSRNNRDISLINVSTDIKKIFEVVELAKYFRIS